MTGSLRIQNGVYQAVIRYKDKDGKKRSISRSTGYEERGNKKKAEAKLNEFIEHLRHLEEGYVPDKPANDGRVLFVDAVNQWLVNKKDTVDKSTYEGHTIYVNKHILPYFEQLNLYVDEVTPHDIKKYYDHKYKKGRRDGKSGGLSIASLKKHGSILRQIFDEAFINDPAKKNPARGVKLPARDTQKTECVFLTRDEANIMLQAFDGHELEALVYITLYYGLRRSEALGLRWSAIDFDKGKIVINHTVVKNLSVEYKNKTKTDSSKRTLDLLDDVRDVLLKLKDRQAENRKMFKREYKNSDYIFKNIDGGLFRPDSLTRSFQRVLKRQGLAQMRFHDLRHSTASIMYDMGCDVKEIQYWLGHANIETTLQIYTHISKLREKATATNLNGIFKLKK